jgi:predicted transcriptional regulator
MLAAPLLRQELSMKRLLLACLLLSSSLPAAAELTVGQPAPGVVLEGEGGGKISGGACHSDSLTGKVHVLFYVDPDERSVNDHVADALQREDFDRSRYGSLAVINLAASWLPNALLQSSLEDKQKQFPHTLYVQDLQKALVSRWGLTDHGNDIVAFDPAGRVLFHRAGTLSEADLDLLIDTIKAHLPR